MVSTNRLWNNSHMLVFPPVSPLIFVVHLDVAALIYLQENQYNVSWLDG